MNSTLTRTVALTALALCAASGCSDPKNTPPQPNPTSSSTKTPQATGPTMTPPTTTQAGPTPDTIIDPRPSIPASANLDQRAQQYATAVSVHRYQDVAAISCPGLLRGMTADQYAQSLADAPKLTLTLADTRPGDIDPDITRELVDPGVTADAQALVTFTVGKNSQVPNPTLVTRFVHSSAGWQYCGAVPNA